MILTLTVNPAIDRNILTDRLAFEDRGYILSRTESAGGRGINASRVIHSFGGRTMAIAPAGGKGRGRFEELLQETGLDIEVIPIRDEIRSNLTISDKHGLTVKLNEVGPKITPYDLKRIEKAVEKKLPKANWLMLCGSVPPGVDHHLYSRLITLAAKKKVKTLLDSDGEALLHGLEGHPTTVMPNQQEAERLLNRALITRTHFLEAAERIQGLGADEVVLSLGSRGAVAKFSGGLFEVVPPRIEAVCPIGAGDALSAAFAWARDRGKEFVDAVKWGVAAGTASAQLPGINYADLQQTTEMYRAVEVRTAA
ncbi:MAG TPA: 1-phosphofructokinase family hexose kinase [Bryobacteraceae bacterium]|nr:1-phosphofructokinase family hexose kinase [Bryobacteraceae bacterium]